MGVPHRCPACDGFGVRFIPERTECNGSSVVTMPSMNVTCHACKGEGIVWEHRRMTYPFGKMGDADDFQLG